MCKLVFEVVNYIYIFYIWIICFTYFILYYIFICFYMNCNPIYHMIFGINKMKLYFFSFPIRKNRRAAHFAAHGLHGGNRVGCPWAAHGNFAMQIRLPPTSIYGNSGQVSGQLSRQSTASKYEKVGSLVGSGVGCPWEFIFDSHSRHL